MSNNFYIRGRRDITVNKTGVVESQTCNYATWQTPTAVTEELLADKNPVAAYKSWVMSRSLDIQEEIYAEDDIFGEGPIVGYETINASKDECLSLDSWIEAVTNMGYEIEFYSL